MTGRVHFIGIGGAGLSAIARVLLERGQAVSGSDRQDSPLLSALAQAGAQVHVGHRAGQVQGAGLVVRSSAIPDDNPEVQAARQAGIPVLKRADYLDELLSGYMVIAVAGTHGKTTTTAILAWVLTALNQDPSYIIGSLAANLGTNAHAGNGEYFVIEADEYDRMFLGLSPDVAVVTNVEHDHPDCYPTPQDFQAAFQAFAEQITKEGVLIGCDDDNGARQLLDEVSRQDRRVRRYGLGRWLGRPRPDYYATDIQPNGHGGYDFRAWHGQQELARVSLQVPGQHNVRNALAALAVADQLNLNVPAAARALGEFRGTARRFEVAGELDGVTFVDDYAHHPTEIRATLAAARARFAGHSIWAVWQPHTYSRTRTLLDEFAASFADADHVVVLEIYPAREDPPEDGFSARQVVGALQHPDCEYAPNLHQAAALLRARVAPPAAVLVLSAGDADELTRRLLAGDPVEKSTGESA